MDLIAVVLGITLLAILIDLSIWRAKGIEPEDEGELEAQISANVRAWADREREALRVEKMFQRLT